MNRFASAVFVRRGIELSFRRDTSRRSRSPARLLPWLVVLPPAAVAAVAAAAAARQISSAPTNKTLLEEEDKSTPESKAKRSSASDDDDYWFFSEEFKLRRPEFWNKIVTQNKQEDPNIAKQEHDEKKKESSSSWTSGQGYEGMAVDFMKLLRGRQDPETIENIVSKVKQQQSNQADDVEDTTDMTQILNIIDEYSERLASTAEKYVGDIDFHKLFPAALLYYLEYEDERKNPSWKRRAHRFCSTLDMDKLEDINRHLELAHLCYADTVDELREGLASNVEPYELVCADLSSAPGMPASFVAVKRDQSYFSPSLDVVIGVRGTKTFADAVTDLMCDSTDYKGGKAHSYVVTSGRHIFEKHTALLEELCKQAGKKTIRLTLVGHSLGAGAASIAGIEFSENVKFDVRVVGFGCPAMLSKDLAEKYTFITTIVNDFDIVPRMSGIHFANLMLDVMEFDWLPYAKKDIRHALDELHRYQPTFFTREAIETINTSIEAPLDRFYQSTVKQAKSERLLPELFPPGRCVHIYRDGYGMSAAIVPNDFFQEIDVNRRMVHDHLLFSGYELTMLEAFRAHTGDHHYRFDDKGKESP